jgi:ligand-binding sensor domain-containing protein
MTEAGYMKRSVLIKITVTIIVCSLLLIGCYQTLVILQSRFIIALGWEGDHYLWMAGGLGVVRWDVNKQVITERAFRPDGIRHFFVSEDGQVWGYGDGVWLFETGKWTNVDETAGLQPGRVHDMLQTSDGTIWIATKWGFKTWNENTRLWASTRVNEPGITLVEDSDNSIWFGLAENGVIRSQSGELTHWTMNEGLIDDRIESMLAANDGTIWVGTHGGVSRWNGSEWQGWSSLGYPDPDGLIVFKWFETRDGTIWADTSQDLARWNHEHWESYERSPSCFGAHTLLEADNGNLWAGCSTGLYRWAETGWHEYGKAEGVLDNRWSRLVEGANGTLYAKTKSGLYQYVPEQDHWQPFPNR